MGRLALAGPPSVVPMEVYGAAFFGASQASVSSQARPHSPRYDPTDNLLGSCNGAEIDYPTIGFVEVSLTYDTDYAITEHERDGEHAWLRIANAETSPLMLEAMVQSFERVQWR